MIWKGKKLETTEDFMKYGIDACASKEEARVFIRQYVLEDYHARANIGYLAGYYNREDQERIFDWFDVVHPIYGTEQLDSSMMMKIGMAHGMQAAIRTRPEQPFHTRKQNGE